MTHTRHGYFFSAAAAAILIFCLHISYKSFLSSSIVDAYAVPANFLEIDVVNPMTTITAGKKRFTDYEVRMRVSMIMLNMTCVIDTLAANIFILSFFMNCDDILLFLTRKKNGQWRYVWVFVSTFIAFIRKQTLCFEWHQLSPRFASYFWFCFSFKFGGFDGLVV